MPYDGTRLDETTQGLIAAKEVLVQEGWCRDTRKDQEGRHCAIGAVDAACGTGEPLYTWAYYTPATPLVTRLRDAIPSGERALRHSDAGFSVADYNNTRESVEEIYEWFDRAIAAGVG